jgi:hypothetical protein
MKCKLAQGLDSCADDHRSNLGRVRYIYCLQFYRPMLKIIVIIIVYIFSLWGKTCSCNYYPPASYSGGLRFESWVDKSVILTEFLCRVSSVPPG